MNDFETLKAMLDRAKIAYSVDEEPPKTIEVHAGYIGFVTEFSFDENGNLKTMGAYE